MKWGWIIGGALVGGVGSLLFCFVYAEPNTINPICQVLGPGQPAAIPFNFIGGAVGAGVGYLIGKHV